MMKYDLDVNNNSLTIKSELLLKKFPFDEAIIDSCTVEAPFKSGEREISHAAVSYKGNTVFMGYKQLFPSFEVIGLSNGDLIPNDPSLYGIYAKVLLGESESITEKEKLRVQGAAQNYLIELEINFLAKSASHLSALVDGWCWAYNLYTGGVVALKRGDSAKYVSHLEGWNVRNWLGYVPNGYSLTSMPEEILECIKQTHDAWKDAGEF